MSAAVRQTSRLGIALWVVLATLLALPVCSGSQEKRPSNATNAGSDEQEIRQLISAYAKAANEADPTLASRVWCDSPEDSLINPVSRWHGVDEILGFYRHDMGEMYSERELKTSDVSVYLYSEAAWAEFNWDFSAKRRKDGSSVSFHGLETQVYRKNRDNWCLVHVHYSALPGETKLGTE